MATSVGSLLRRVPLGETSVIASSLLALLHGSSMMPRPRSAAAEGCVGESAMASRAKQPSPSVSASMSAWTCSITLRLSMTRGGAIPSGLPCWSRSASSSVMTLSSLPRGLSASMTACISPGSVSSISLLSRSTASRKSPELRSLMVSRLMIICSWLKRLSGSTTEAMPPDTASSFSKASRSARLVCMESDSRCNFSTKCRMFCIRKSQRLRRPQALTYSTQASEKSGSRSCSCLTRSKSLDACLSSAPIRIRIRLALASSFTLAAWSFTKPSSFPHNSLVLAQC
mmetsp:Transcript_99022/g.295809  ORF Transcript_99022/g.295809 Transcript_99022/m.295809 type:complete len:285 (+) Transcript_99022:218-1072(+)